MEERMGVSAWLTDGCHGCWYNVNKDMWNNVYEKKKIGGFYRTHPANYTCKNSFQRMQQRKALEKCENV